MPQQAVNVVLQSIPDAPIWPQLPANGLNEQMEIQYSEGIPRVVIDREKDRMYFDTTGDTSAELAEFYEKYLRRGPGGLPRSRPEFSKGIYAMEAALQAAGGHASLREGADHRPAQLRPQHRRREQARHLLQPGIRRRGGEGAWR